ncbi:hypothetical protein J1605_001338 [Eschrichtius robustus]|uniref:Transmembrane protein 203 n=1 Tax=Eschrichtius robustus TaxID=9764 RepID=A0AB34G826_ESCRO|nr:hypothetical protein J1605_001338 [Eschrichtius robustus]
MAPARPVGSGGAAGRVGPSPRPWPALGELVQWLGFAPFEVFVHLLALSVFSGLLALRVDGLAPGLSWWNVFVPFFAADRLSTYFTTVDGEKRLAVLRLFWVLTVLSLKFVLEIDVVVPEAGGADSELRFGLITSPVFILLQLRVIPACRVN